MGAGWQEREHTKFGIPFYDFPTRYDMLEEALELTIKLLESDIPVDYEGKHFSLKDAILLPRPQRQGGPPILIGGSGPKRTMPLVAKYADEWNCVFRPIEVFKERNQLLAELLEKNGRPHDDIKRSLMTEVVYEKDESRLKERLTARNTTAEDLISRRGLIVGTGPAVVEQIGRWAEAGVERFMLQWLDLDNIEGLENMAKDVLPHFHN
jgi:alkanesulfonate monooxygenase SsuD/methylene tetrahydromethanopterin reductase-like flavin-dependent oxidoreductase (luciferase family)